jgi:hypothetical protein
LLLLKKFACGLWHNYKTKCICIYTKEGAFGGGKENGQTDRQRDRDKTDRIATACRDMPGAGQANFSSPAPTVERPVDS